MIIGFADNAWEDYLYWQKNDKKILKRINLLLKDIKRNPYDSKGLGKPERLKENLNGYYSRRITSEHRLVYKVVCDLIIVAQCRYHY
ncbi:MAG: Txe/YoeB family addiction module toxin [Flexistipes sinusarabici]|uniref:Putative mRNA interferase YoeB n=1 Tax=Flexistipes sinusarabici TaxID=2352 RepID=A0A5D0MTR2_FLESI|nr:Txe/YoeB family addiction module toxin [Flexistipes sinusarabici]TYB35507.1 MAG: Txe/YoeB family addiction module toxin [Flexistipes sinusarabici]